MVAGRLCAARHHESGYASRPQTLCQRQHAADASICKVHARRYNHYTSVSYTYAALQHRLISLILKVRFDQVPSTRIGLPYSQQ